MRSTHVYKLCTIAVVLCGTIVGLAGCESREIKIPRVTEESLTPEQKAQLQRMREAQANVMQRAGNPQVSVNPEEFAKQRFEEEQAARQAAASDGDTAQ